MMGITKFLHLLSLLLNARAIAIHNQIALVIYDALIEQEQSLYQDVLV
jgi:hypothetical protein